MSKQNPPSAPLRYVACVSYPRSGHHLTVRVLSHYFRQDFRYCQFYNKQEGECCRSFPCTDASVSFTKNHDMDLNFPTNPGVPKVEGVPYLVLIRNFLEAVVSDYNLFLREHQEDTLEAWRGFSQRKLRFYRRFLRKWVLAEDAIEKLVVPYEQLTGEPLTWFARMIDFFHPARPVDGARLEKIVAEAVLEDVKPTGIEVIRNFGVRNRRRIEDFQHFDQAYFAELEGALTAELTELGYPRRFAA